jgi:hypothetical protein
MLRPHLTYANVVASLALFVALGGGSYAAVALSRNSVGATQIRRAAVGPSELKRDAVDSVRVRNRSLREVDFAPGQLPVGRGATGLTGPIGAQGAAGPAGPTGLTGPPGAPNPNADTVDGVSAARFTYGGATNTGPETILTLGGLSLRASCIVPADIVLEATTTVGDSVVLMQSSVGNTNDPDVDVTESPELINGLASPGSGTITYQNPAGSLVTIVFWSWGDSNAFDNCSLAGHAMHSTP